MSLDRTVLCGLSSSSFACWIDHGLLFLLLLLLPNQSYFMTHWGLHKGNTGRRESEPEVSIFGFLLTGLGRGLVRKRISTNDLNMSSGSCNIERKMLPVIEAYTHFPAVACTAMQLCSHI